jgi:hypothetical protein
VHFYETAKYISCDFPLLYLASRYVVVFSLMELASSELAPFYTRVEVPHGPDGGRSSMPAPRIHLHVFKSNLTSQRFLILYISVHRLYPASSFSFHSNQVCIAGYPNVNTPLPSPSTESNITFSTRALLGRLATCGRLWKQQSFQSIDLGHQHTLTTVTILPNSIPSLLIRLLYTSATNNTYLPSCLTPASSTTPVTVNLHHLNVPPPEQHIIFQQQQQQQQQ